jgi:hypothetical protein
MPDPDLKTRERYGVRFDGPVFRDGVFLIRDKATDSTSFAILPFVTAANFDTIKPISNQLPFSRMTAAAAGVVAAGITNIGVVAMGAGDGLELSFAGEGADNNTGEYVILAYEPCFSVAANADPGKQIITGYYQRPIAFGVLTLSARVLGAAGLAALAGGTGLSAANDRLADTITYGLGTAGWVEVTSNGSDLGAATIRVPARGSPYLGVATRVVTATNTYAFGKRWQGGGAGAMRA